jgi:hypothetical protein
MTFSASDLLFGTVASARLQSADATAVTEGAGLPLSVSAIGTAGNTIAVESIDLVRVLSGLASNSALTISHSSAAATFAQRSLQTSPPRKSAGAAVRISASNPASKFSSREN